MSKKLGRELSRNNSMIFLDPAENLHRPLGNVSKIQTSAETGFSWRCQAVKNIGKGALWRWAVKLQSRCKQQNWYWILNTSQMVPKKCGNSLKFPIKLMRCSILGGWDYWWCKPNSFSVSPDHWDIKCLGDTSRTMVPEVMQKHVQLLPIGNHNPYPCMSLPLFGWYWKTTVTQKGYNFGVGHIPQL